MILAAAGAGAVTSFVLSVNSSLRRTKKNPKLTEI